MENVNNSVEDLALAAIEEANQSCTIGTKWGNWDELYLETVHKSAHGKFTNFFSSYKGQLDAYNSVCTNCSKVTKKVLKKIREVEKLQQQQNL